jgi:hypothetical protein
MKTIELFEGKEFATKKLILEVVRPSRMGMDLEELRKRCRILAALETAEVVLQLEDADYDVLCGILRGFAYGTASSELLKIVDDILDLGAK